MKTVIPGGSGQVGQVLAQHFHGLRHEVVVMSRQPQPTPWRTVPWDARELEGADVVINLAGRSVNCRYHQRNRRSGTSARAVDERQHRDDLSPRPRPPDG